MAYTAMLHFVALQSEEQCSAMSAKTRTPLLPYFTLENVSDPRLRRAIEGNDCSRKLSEHIIKDSTRCGEGRLESQL